MSSDVKYDLSQSLSDQSMSTTMLDDLPDEIILFMMKNLPLISLGNLAKVNKRTNRLVNEFKQSVTYIHSSDIEQIAILCGIDISSDHYIEQNIAFKFKDKLVDMISNFPKVEVIAGSQIINNLIVRLCHIQDYLWYDLAKIIPNIRSLFDIEDVLGYRDRSYDDVLCLKVDFMEYVLQEYPMANPCCDQIIKIGYPDRVDQDADPDYFIFKNHHLTCKLDFCQQNEPPHNQEPILSRRVDLYVDNSTLDIIKYELPNITHIEIDGEPDIGLYKSKISRFCPNLKSIEIHSDSILEDIIKYVDFDNNHILSLNYFTTRAISDGDLKSIFTIMLNKDRFLEFVEINSLPDHIRHLLKIIITKNKLALFPSDKYITFETNNIYVQIERVYNYQLPDLFRPLPDIPARIFVSQDENLIKLAVQEWFQGIVNSVIE